MSVRMDYRKEIVNLSMELPAGELRELLALWLKMMYIRGIN
jgi:hypothetical protein